MAGRLSRLVLNLRRNIPPGTPLDRHLQRFAKLAGWVGAALVTIYGFSSIQPIAQQWISSKLLADAATGATLFLISLIVLTFFSHAITARVSSCGCCASTYRTSTTAAATITVAV